MEILIVRPKNKEQLKALKAVLKALKVDFRKNGRNRQDFGQSGDGKTAGGKYPTGQRWQRRENVIR